jgi:selenocysteine lyase/cysteine desulfurase
VRGGPPDDERVRLLRDVLTATGAGMYLATHVAGPVPAEVAAAVRESNDLELRLGRAAPGRDEDHAQRDREARAVLAAVVRASPERLLLTHGTAEAARLVALSVLGGLAAGAARRAVAVTGLEPPVLEALRGVCGACGVELAEVAEEDAMPAGEDAELPGDMAFVAAPHVTAAGRVLDVGRLGRDARGAPLLLDVSLSVGALPLDVAGLGAHAIIGAAHRWLLGPEGVAFAWLAPALGEGTPEQLRAATSPFPRGALLALARSVGWLLMYAELPWVLERTARLAARCHTALSALPGVRLATPTHHAALLAWSIEGWSADQAVEELEHSVFAILDADEEAGLVRAGIGAWNREDELDRLVARVGELAAHTPASLPRRPALTVLGSTPEEGA